MKYVKTFKHTTVLEMDREFFTPCGLQVNGLVKETISKPIVAQI
jgi:hypothetical protein